MALSSWSRGVMCAQSLGLYDRYPEMANDFKKLPGHYSDNLGSVRLIDG